MECKAPSETEADRATKPARNTDAFFRAITHNSSDIIIVVDGEGKIIYVNQAIERFLGYQPDTLTGRSAFDFILPEEVPRAVEDFSRSLATTGELIHNSFHIMHRNGSHRLLEGVGANLLDNPEVRGFVMNVRDVTDREEAENARRESEKKFREIAERLVAARTADLEETNRKLEEEIIANNRIREAVIHAKKEWERTFDSVPDLIAIMDADNQIVRLNKAMAEKMGLTPQQAIGMKCHELVHGANGPPPWCPRALLLADGQEHAAEVYVDSWKGIYDISVSPLQDEKGRLMGCVHIGRDVTERKQKKDLLEKKVSERTAELSEKNRQLVKEIKDRKRAEAALTKKARELQLHSVKLEELNVALKVIISKREEDRTDLEDKVLSNVKHLLTPHFEAMRTKKLDPECRTVLEILEANVNKLTSSFSQRLSSKYLNFTPTEIRVADLVKEGKSIKEMAELMGVSHFTVDLHRFNIRKKLGLKSRKINLRSYLLSFS